MADAINKLEMFEVWRGFLEGRGHTSIQQIQKKNEFLEAIEDLFDIAYAKAIELIINEDRKFLEVQRKKRGKDTWVVLTRSQSIEAPLVSHGGKAEYPIRSYGCPYFELYPGQSFSGTSAYPSRPKL